MANESVATARDVDIELVTERIEEALAIQEMASRLRVESEEDSETLKAAARATRRLLEDVYSQLLAGSR